MGKGIPAAHWASVATKGFQLVYGATANLFIDRHGQYIGYGPEAAELVGLPDVDTFCPLPWDPKVARVFCTLFRGREESDEPGAFLTSDCRGNLHRLHAQFTADTGLTLRAGCEPEMMWLKTNADGTPSVEGMTKPYCYHIDQFSELQPVIHRVIEYGTAMGLDMIQGDHEDAPGSWSSTSPSARPRTPPTASPPTARSAGRSAGSSGCSPASCPSPSWASRPTGATTTSRSGRTTSTCSCPRATIPRMPSKTGLHAIGGVLTHLRALTAITAPTVNSYRRFADAGFWAPSSPTGGSRTAPPRLRVSAPGRFEYRSVDSAVNPYLSMAGLLVAMRDGLDQSIDPGSARGGQHLRRHRGGQVGRAHPLDPRRGPRRPRSRPGHPPGPPRRDARRLPPLQAGRVGALHRHGHRLGRQGIPRHPAVTPSLAPLPVRGPTVLVSSAPSRRRPRRRSAPLLDGRRLRAGTPSSSMRARRSRARALRPAGGDGRPQTSGRRTQHPWLADEKAGHTALGARLWTARASASASGTSCWPTRWAATVRPMAPGDRRERDRAHARGRATTRSSPAWLRSGDAGVAGLQWHGAEVVEPPPGAVVLARTEQLRGAGDARGRRGLGRAVPPRGRARHRARVGGGARVRAHPGRAFGSRRRPRGGRGTSPRRPCDAVARRPRPPGSRAHGSSASRAAARDQDAGRWSLGRGAVRAERRRAEWLAAWRDRRRCARPSRAVRRVRHPAGEAARAPPRPPGLRGRVEFHRRHPVVGPGRHASGAPAVRRSQPAAVGPRHRAAPYPFEDDAAFFLAEFGGAAARALAPLPAPRMVERAAACGGRSPGSAGSSSASCSRTAARTPRARAEPVMPANRCWSALTMATEEEDLAGLVGTLEAGASPSTTCAPSWARAASRSPPRPSRPGGRPTHAALAKLYTKAYFAGAGSTGHVHGPAGAGLPRPRRAPEPLACTRPWTASPLLADGARVLSKTGACGDRRRRGAPARAVGHGRPLPQLVPALRPGELGTVHGDMGRRTTTAARCGRAWTTPRASGSSCGSPAPTPARTTAWPCCSAPPCGDRAATRTAAAGRRPPDGRPTPTAASAAPRPRRGGRSLRRPAPRPGHCSAPRSSTHFAASRRAEAAPAIASSPPRSATATSLRYERRRRERVLKTGRRRLSRLEFELTSDRSRPSTVTASSSSTASSTRPWPPRPGPLRGPVRRAVRDRASTPTSGTGGRARARPTSPGRSATPGSPTATSPGSCCGPTSAGPVRGWEAGPGARLSQDNVLWKPPGGKALGFHQDSSYEQWAVPSEWVSCWIALEDTTAAQGTVEYVRGSHRWARTWGMIEQFHGPDDPQAELRQAAARERRGARARPRRGAGGRRGLPRTAGPGTARTSTAPRCPAGPWSPTACRRRLASTRTRPGYLYSRYKRFGDDVMDESFFPDHLAGGRLPVTVPRSLRRTAAWDGPAPAPPR